MPLDLSLARMLQGLSDATVRRPLWTFHPSAALYVLRERARRNILQTDPEPIGDPEYN